MTDERREGWQPIVSAPAVIDATGYGPTLLCWDGSEVFTASRAIDGSWEDAQDYYGRERWPTHWMPLPNPPEVVQDEG